jgi:hypothetical protein
VAPHLRADLKSTADHAHNKILSRTLIHEKFRHDRVAGDPLYRRARGAPEFGPFTDADEAALHAEFESHGRARVRAWEL